MGKMGQIHLSALNQLAAGGSERYYKGGVSELLAKLTVCGLCDIRPPHTADYPNIELFNSVETMLQQTQPHLLIVATPTPTHKTIAMAAMCRGVHTLVEKPVVTAMADLDELLALAERSGVRLMAGHVERYNPVSMKIKSLLGNARPTAQRYAFARTQRHDPRIADDIVVDKVIHDLDLALYFFGVIARIEWLGCRRQEGRIFEADLALTHQNGIQGRIFVSWLTDTPDKTRQVEIEQGGHCWKGDFSAKRLWVDGHEIQCSVPGWIEPANNQIKDELVDFIVYCTEPAEGFTPAPLLTVQEMLESVRWLEYIQNKIEQQKDSI
jgi:predicted dehydrogenase